MHGDEPVDFDIVVACGIRVTRYGDNSSSFDAFRWPPFFVQATRDGGAVLQQVPNACHGQTTQNGEAPKDLLPGAIWFDKAGDFTFGIGYTAEDAFENPASKLKFLGAEISKATRAEWEAFGPTLAQNLLSPEPFVRVGAIPQPTEDEIKTNLWNKAKLAEWQPTIACYGIERFRLTDPVARELLRSYWPAARPRFWMPPARIAKNIRDELFDMNSKQGAMLDGHPYGDYLLSYRNMGYPTRAKGGMLDGAGRKLPSELHPFRADDGLPWITSAIASADAIYRDVELSGNTGFLYCYHFWRYASRSIVESHLPHYYNRHFVTRVEGTAVELQGSPGVNGSDFPFLFFEDDQNFYTVVELGLD